MRVLMAHNYYQRSGGEDAVFHSERALLERAGHQVITYERRNSEIAGYSLGRKLRCSCEAVWARRSFDAIGSILERERPDVVHFHNTLPLISPAAYYACREAGVPVVQTLHNYRLFCPAASPVRNGRACEDCLGAALSWPGVLHGCYRASRAQTAVVAALLAVHRRLGTWRERVDVYVALTRFAGRKFVQSGVPAERVVVKPNFVHPDPGEREAGGEHVLFVGRLSPAKGVRTLLEAWGRIGEIPLEIAGEGPLGKEVRTCVRLRGLENVSVLGGLSHDSVLALMKRARFLVLPSEWYEAFPLVIVEAFACGVPVIASRLGSMAEIVEDGCTGLHFAAGDSAALADRVAWAWANPDEMRRMGREARAEYECRYTAEQNYGALMAVYEKAMGGENGEAG
jgi:glycosyltransferase involved in cell wall biosynthesis